MRGWQWSTVILAALLGACSGTGASAPAGSLTAAQAAQHVGEQATVCGMVASAHRAAASHRQPTFINLDEAYPRQVFTIVIWGDYRGRFAKPPETWHGHLCATGVITAYHGKPEMKVISPSQIVH